jgi:hypothetical protein
MAGLELQSVSLLFVTSTVSCQFSSCRSCFLQALCSLAPVHMQLERLMSHPCVTRSYSFFDTQSNKCELCLLSSAITCQVGPLLYVEPGTVSQAESQYKFSFLSFSVLPFLLFNVCEHFHHITFSVLSLLRSGRSVCISYFNVARVRLIFYPMTSYHLAV